MNVESRSGEPEYACIKVVVWTGIITTGPHRSDAPVHTGRGGEGLGECDAVRGAPYAAAAPRVTGHDAGAVDHAGLHVSHGGHGGVEAGHAGGQGLDCCGTVWFDQILGILS